MARAFLTSIDLAKNELLNAVVQNLASHPSNPVEGLIYFNTTDHSFYIYANGSWVTWSSSGTLGGHDGAYYLSRSHHTDTQLANTISDFDSQVRSSRLDQMAVPTTSVSMNSQKITNLATPTSNGDAANKSYVDGVAQGISAKDSVKAATTDNITLSGEQTIDDVALVAGDRVLVKNQSAVPEVSSIDFTGLTEAGLAGKYFVIYSPTVAYYVWFNLDGESSDPAPGDTPGIEIAIATGDVDTVIAGKVQAVLNVHSEFSAILSTATVNVTNLVGGPTNNADTGNSGAIVTTTTQGAVAGLTNGVYTVNVGAWTRALDTDTWNKIISAYVFVQQGTVNADSGWLCTADVGGTLGVSTIDWVQFSQAGTVTATNVGLGTIDVFKQKSGTSLEFRTLDDSTSVNVSQANDIITFDVKPAGVNMNNLGGGPLSVLNGGTGSTTAAGAKTNLGFVTKFSANVGNGSDTSFNLTHSLGTLDVIVQVRSNGSTKSVVEPDIVIVDVDTVQISFNSAPTSNQYRVNIIG